MMRSNNKKTERPSSGGTIDHIPEEIVVKILSRLPVKSLLRFSCVRKSWQVTINSNPRFISQHLTRSTVRADGGNLILRRRVSSITRNSREFLHLDIGHGSSQYLNDVQVPSSFEDARVASVRSSDGGLFLLEVMKCSKECYVVWNPATRLVKRISLDKFYCNKTLSCFVAFGVVPEDCDYKLVRIQIYKKSLEAEKGNDVLIQLYSRLSGSWREIDATAFPTYYDIKNGMQPTFLPGTCWGLVAKGVVYWILQTPNIIAGFNLRDQVFLQLPMPEIHAPEGVVKLAEVKGSLALITLTLGVSYSVWKTNEGVDQTG